MMRTLAEYIMRGRFQAIAMALLGSWVPLLSQGALGLVTLRKGWQEGLIITLWASLPAFAALWLGNVAKVLAVASIVVMFVGYLSALTLRYTVSWPATLAGTVAFSCFAAVSVAISVDNVGDQVLAFFRDLAEAEGNQAAQDQLKLFQDWTVTRAAGVIAVWITLTSVSGVLLARWWQAILYNPGGFQQEFHRLRLTPVIALLSTGALIWAESRGPDYFFWGSVFGMPLLVAGIGLVHCAAARFRTGPWPLAVFYLGLFLIPPLGLIVSLLGLTDVWIDYRKRFDLLQH